MEIDAKLLKDYNITPNQYMLVYLAYKNRTTDFNRLKKLYDIDTELKEAERKGFIKLKGENLPQDIEIRNKFLFILGEGDYFDELVNEYPIKVIRPEGTKDYLRTDLKRCRKTYNREVSTKKKHERIMKALRYEKKVREQESSWKWMKKLPKWLSSEEWKVFEERMEDEAQETDGEKLGYGQELK